MCAAPWPPYSSAATALLVAVGCLLDCTYSHYALTQSVQYGQAVGQADWGIFWGIFGAFLYIVY